MDNSLRMSLNRVTSFVFVLLHAINDPDGNFNDFLKYYESNNNNNSNSNNSHFYQKIISSVIQFKWIVGGFCSLAIFW